MAALRILGLASALLGLVSAPADASAREAVRRWRVEIAEASSRFGVPVVWIEGVMRAESGGQITWSGRPITSRAGAMGLMQLMPATWLALRARLQLGTDPHNPRDNILAGTYYLRLMYDRFGYPGLFAAYNAGPRRYQDHLIGRGPLPTETRHYLTKVLGLAEKTVAMTASPARGALFAIREPAPEVNSVAPTPIVSFSSDASLFVRRKGP
jgi:soluble lytic murein transglycosylase-like protein